MNKKKLLLKAKKRELATTGRLLFSAFFGAPKAFERQVEREFGEEAHPREMTTAGPAKLTEGYSFVRCSSCAREQAVAVHLDARSLEQSGWRLDAGSWRCPFCVGR
jgi:hypothetical protein